MSHRIDSSNAPPQLVCAEGSEPTTTAAAPAARTSPASHVRSFGAQDVRAERQRATEAYGVGEEALGRRIRDLDRNDFAILRLHGFVKAEFSADVEERATIRHEPDDSWTVELQGKVAAGLGEAATGAEVAAVGEGAVRLRFASPEAAADFLQAVSTGVWGASRAMEWAEDRGTSVRLGAGLKAEVGSDHDGVGKQLALFAKAGADLEGGLSYTIDRERGELIAEARLEGSAAAAVTAPFVKAVNVGGQLKLEAKIEHRVKLDAETLERVARGGASPTTYLGAGELVLKVEGQADLAAAATLAGAGALLKVETEVALGRPEELSTGRLAQALEQGEVKVQVFTSKEKDTGGLGIDARIAGLGFSWRTHRLSSERTTTLGTLAGAVRDTLAEVASGACGPANELETRAAALRALQ